MTLAPGTHLGPYLISNLLGAGGMGEVYRARDPRLNRDVAIKVLPTALAADAERLRRFEQEAHAAAALNHPNILATYDVGVFDRGEPQGSSGLAQAGSSSPYLVSELLEGETLEDRLHRGPLAVRKVIEHVAQLATGLAAAHEKGIVHRDLKPANVLVTLDGRVKILDFGLAKLTEPASGGADVDTQPPTATLPGQLLGTIAYMSPEQVRGQAADHRSDIFAVGLILFEMLSGRRAFHGQTSADVMSAILEQDPPELPVAERRIPPGLVRIVLRCLEKAPAARFQSAGDLAFALEGLTTHSESGVSPATAGHHARARWPWIAATAIAVLAVFGLIAMPYVRAPQANAPGRHSHIGLPGAPPRSLAPSFALSPDAGHLAYIAGDRSGHRMLWIRPLDSDTVRSLPGTEDAEAPFWSPDSKSVAFVAGGRLRRVSASGGPVTTVADRAYAAPGAWNRDDVILFTPGIGSPLSRVAAAHGGTLSAVTALNASAGESTHALPFFLPDGLHFLYAAWSPSGAPIGVYIGSLDSMEGTLLEGLEGIANAQYARDTVIFVKDAAVAETVLMARGFDADRRIFTGDAVTIADRISVGDLSVTGVGSRTGEFSVSETGDLVYRALPAQISRLVLLDRGGGEVRTLGSPAAYGDMYLSPDDRLVGVNIASSDGTYRLWLIDTEHGAGDRLTSDASNEAELLFEPDGSRIAFNSSRAGGLDLYVRPLSGGSDVVVLEDDTIKYLQSWSRDDYLLYTTTTGPNVSMKMWTVPVVSGGTPTPFLQREPSAGMGSTFSPDGRWVAFPSNRTGPYEVYVSRFPEDSASTRVVSTAGGMAPRWGVDGRELFYYERNTGRLMVVELTYSEGGVRPGAPKPLFKVQLMSPWAAPYAVTRDAKRFIVNTPVDQAAQPQLEFLQNWPALLDR